MTLKHTEEVACLAELDVVSLEGYWVVDDEQPSSSILKIRVKYGPGWKDCVQYAARFLNQRRGWRLYVSMSDGSGAALMGRRSQAFLTSEQAAKAILHFKLIDQGSEGGDQTALKCSLRLVLNVPEKEAEEVLVEHSHPEGKRGLGRVFVGEGGVFTSTLSEKTCTVEVKDVPL